MSRQVGRHGEVTEARIFAAAERLFAAKGYAAVSMRQIASEVGVQVGTLYLYVTDKQSLLRRLMVGHMDEVLADYASAAAPEDTDALTRLKAFVIYHVDYHTNRSDAVFLAYMELRSLEPEGFAEVRDRRRAYEEKLVEILAAGEAEGLWTLGDRRVASLALIGMLTGVQNWFKEDGRLPKATLVEEYWRLVQGALGLPVGTAVAAG